MSKLSVPFKGTVIVTLVALAMATFAVSNVFAAGYDTTAPSAGYVTTAPSSQMSADMMANTWKSEVSSLAFDNIVLSRADKLLIGKDQIRVPVGNGITKEVTFQDVNVMLAKAQSIATAHAGFDATGQITDQAQAVKSVATLGGYLDQLRTLFFHSLARLVGPLA